MLQDWRYKKTYALAITVEGSQHVAGLTLLGDFIAVVQETSPWLRLYNKSGKEVLAEKVVGLQKPTGLENMRNNSVFTDTLVISDLQNALHLVGLNCTTSSVRSVSHKVLKLDKLVFPKSVSFNMNCQLVVLSGKKKSWHLHIYNEEGEEQQKAITLPNADWVTAVQMKEEPVEFALLDRASDRWFGRGDITWINNKGEQIRRQVEPDN